MDSRKLQWFKCIDTERNALHSFAIIFDENIYSAITNIILKI